MNEDPFRQGSENLFDNLPDAVIAVDTAGTICVFNRRAQRLFGYSAKEALGQKIEILVPEPIKEPHVTFRENYLRSPTDFCIDAIREVTALRKDGIEFPVDITLSPQLVDGKTFVFAAVRDATQRLHLENRLLESEERYRQVVNNSKDVIFRANAAGEWTFLNPAWTEITGINSEAALGQPITNFVHPQDRERHRAYFLAIVSREKEHCRDEFRYLVQPSKAFEETSLHDANNNYRWIEMHCRGLVDEATGEVVGTTGVLRDITRRKTAEEAVKKSEQRYRELVETMNEALATADENYVFTYVNRRFCEILGYENNELLGQHLLDFIHPCNRELMENQIALRKKGITERFELAWIAKDGKKVNTLASPKGVFDSEGHFKGSFGVLTDITDLKLAEQVAKESERRFRLLVDQAPDAFYLHDLAGNILDVNKQACKSLGYARDELLNLNVVDIEHNSDLAALRENWQAHEIDRPYSIESINRRKDGKLFPVEIHNRRFKSGNRELILALVSDITAQKQSAQELARLDKHIRLLLESAGEGIFGVDDSGHCTFINTAALETLGFTYAELFGMSVHEAIHHTRTDGSPYRIEECPVYQSYHDGKRRHVNNEVLWRKDGTSFPADYSSYPINEDGRISGAVVVFRNVAEARAMSRKMDYLATHDSLTGLINRREFEVRLNAALQVSYEEGSEHVLCYIDLDQFKVVNDTRGHVAGDELLRQISTLLHSKIRQGDSFARLGGDEFGLLLEYCSLDQALLIIAELKRTVQEFRFIWEDLTFVVGASFGVVSINQNTESIAVALSSADTACYMAKDKGRNRIHIYQADDAEVAQRHGEMQWVSKIHDAYEQGHFFLAYQPIVPFLAGKEQQLHIELLIRMHDDVGHTVPPGSFIPAAERYNIMSTVDRWVIRTSFDWLNNNQNALSKIGFCSINLSGHSLSDENFLEFVTSQFRQQGIPPEKICFEITETTAVANLTGAIHFMESLKRLGCRFALDDFGSGMSSFAYLKNLPVDFLKIDGNFIRDIVVDPVDYAMVEAINQVGHVMGLQTIAEFVENDAIVKQLQRIGVDFAQGFGIAKPRPLTNFTPDYRAPVIIATEYSH